MVTTDPSSVSGPLRRLEVFRAAIAPWRAELAHGRICFVGRVTNGRIAIIAARVFLAPTPFAEPRPDFGSGDLVAAETALPTPTEAESAITQLVSGQTLHLRAGTDIYLPRADRSDYEVADPEYLHPEGLRSGDRLAVLSVRGAQLDPVLAQPVTDWLLKAADSPYDSLIELLRDYRLGGSLDKHALLEVVVASPIEVWNGSQ